MYTCNMLLLLASEFEHPIRLVNGSVPNEGTIEVLRSGGWGLICGYSWDLREANVACRMLGYDGK